MRIGRAGPAHPDYAISADSAIRLVARSSEYARPPTILTATRTEPQDLRCVSMATLQVPS